MELLSVLNFNGLHPESRYKRTQVNQDKRQIQKKAETKTDAKTKDIDKDQSKTSAYFGTSVSEANERQPRLQDCLQTHTRVFRDLIEPHIAKARARRLAACDQVWARWDEPGKEKTSSLAPSYSKILHIIPIGLREEADLRFNVKQHRLREAFCKATRLHELTYSSNARLDCDLSQIHQTSGCKDSMLANLTCPSNSKVFQLEFDEFVRSVIAPTVIATNPQQMKGVYYQSFPCIRIIRPRDFSIGPHADVAYGHSPFSINFYVPLTDIYGTSSLYLESSAGAEDWHPIVGGYGDIKRFPGALSLHWTLENFTPHSRVSFDFRVIPDYLYRENGVGQGNDVYSTSGYYAYCEPSSEANSSGKERGCGSIPFTRVGDLLPPDYRCGYPFGKK
jgi:hypothetical protein